MTRAQVRAYARRLLGLESQPTADSQAEREARRRARLEADAVRWARQEVAERERRTFERVVESEIVKARLEHGPLFPGAW
jgi:hypothetical protein